MAGGKLPKDVISYDTSDYAWYTSSDMSNGYNGASNSSTYATINLTRGNGAETHVYWNFGSFSDIPANAVITSVECKVRCLLNQTNASRITERTAQLYSGSTAMGASTILGNTTSVQTIAGGTWTRAQLQNARVKIHAVRGGTNSNTTYYFRFYGATLTVTYYYFEVKQNGSWVPVKKVLVKQSGSWEDAKEVLTKDNGTWK